jgi:hypothetical protein
MSDHELAVTGLIIGIAGIVAGILASYYFYLKARERIDPRYLLQYEPLVGSSSGAMRDVSVLYRDTEITNLNRCVLAIWNRGTRAITRDAVAENDKVRVCLPKGASALGTGIAWVSRPAVNLSASASDTGSAVTIGFDFLDKDDGGVIEILYQGDPKLPPTLSGSIMGAPKGVRSVPGTLQVGPYEFEAEDEDEDEDGVWRGWLIWAIALCASAAVSTVMLGAAFPLSVILYTLIAEAIIVMIFFAALKIFLRRVIGFPQFFKEIPRTGGDRSKIVID